MAKQISWTRGLSSILFWSIISAAFIGPGTVTTAAKAGATYQIDLLWALVFSIIATIILQEMAARISIASGKNLGQVIALKYGESRGLRWFIFLSVAFGCAAYQAGNLLGAISGLLLFDAVPMQLGLLLLGALCFALLWIGNYKLIAQVLGVVVALMGGIFIYVATFTDYSLLNLAQKVIIPNVPDGSGLLIIGLIGTTIVPYNLFLASGISKGQEIREMRIGLIIAIIVGGIISIAILLVGTQVTGVFSFESLTEALSSKLGKWGDILFGLGLFAAGMSSSITSPLAAAVTAQSIVGNEKKEWGNRGKNFRMVWIIILGLGLLLGMMDIQVIPAIILAQAINGALLPLVAIFLVLAANDQNLLGVTYSNKWFSNFCSFLIVGLSCFLGLNNLGKAVGRTLQIDLSNAYYWMIAGLSFIVVLFLFRKVYLVK